MNCTVILLMLAALFTGCSSQEPEVDFHEDPEAATFIVEDIPRFWAAYDTAFAQQTPPQQRASLFQELYFAPGTVGLSQFTTRRIQNAGQLVATLEVLPEYYASIRETTLQFPSQSNLDAMRNSFWALKRMYPDARFADVYFLMGRMSSGGTVSDQGLLVAIELFSLTSETPTHELNSWQRSVTRTPDAIPFIVAHELVHIQQSYLNRLETLLARTIAEGSADFIAEKISGSHLNTHLHPYGDSLETVLWDRFKLEMNGTDHSNWLYNGGTAGLEPADLGYYLGYKISEAYYNRASDKSKALRDMLTITDFNTFLEESGYDGGR